MHSRRNVMKMGVAAVAAGAFSDLAFPDPAVALASDVGYIGGSKYAYINTLPEIAEDLGDQSPEVFYTVGVWNPSWNSSYVRSQLSGFRTGGRFIDTWRDHKYARATAPQSDITGFDGSTEMNVKVHGWNHVTGSYNEQLHYESDQASQFYHRHLSIHEGRPYLPNADDFTWHEDRTPWNRDYTGVALDTRYDDQVAETFQLRHFFYLNRDLDQVPFVVIDAWVDDTLGWRRFFRRINGDIGNFTVAMLNDWATNQTNASFEFSKLDWVTKKVSNLLRAITCSGINAIGPSGLTNFGAAMQNEILAGGDAAAGILTGHQNFGYHRAYRNAASNIAALTGNGEGQSVVTDGWRVVNLAALAPLEIDYDRFAVLETRNLHPLDENTDGDPSDLAEAKEAEAPDESGPQG